ncbi:uncharacterized protein BKA55DRAFT_538712 [Fusarium redolens]|uniref:Myb-like domain-containing protein n=1 Tax=Fusarium redolens TaxID=48865 RepID=A0A9P9KAA1_FUSRE|nr:uncharacterized protein BKA55DRAFT_538712 [Fusarium redolens]KAH7253858.1 hypothetical protein BKA55DRAFT_538712 [Fusarium redolens]
MSGINNETPPNALKPWQVRALAKGRTPLPESPGCRPWLEDSPAQEASEPGQVVVDTTASSLTSLPSSPRIALSSSQAEMNSHQGYKFWNQDEVRRLIELKREGKSWRDISEHFPERTIEAIKQTYHKRRSTAEEQMRPVIKKGEDQPME